MKLYTIACESLFRESMLAASRSPHVVDVKFLPFGLHNTPDQLRQTIQAEIDAATGYDYILLGYGLCSRGTADLVSRDIPIVVPRVHDCITLFLGSRKAYDREFLGHPGTYYYSPGWIERKEGEVDQGSIEIVQNRLETQRYREYVEKYGEDNAKYLIEQERLWLSNYDRAVFINMGIGDQEFYREFTRGAADANGWAYEEVEGDMQMIDRLFFGKWDTDEFLVVQPGQRTFEDVNGEIISAG